MPKPSKAVFPTTRGQRSRHLKQSARLPLAFPAPGEITNRFFARLRAFDLSCPRCGKVWVIGAGGHRTYNPRTQRWRCATDHGGCGQRLSLGLIAYLVPNPGPFSETMAPFDTIPNPREALELRNAAAGHWSGLRRKPRDRANRLAMSGLGKVEPGSEGSEGS